MKTRTLFDRAEFEESGNGAPQGGLTEVQWDRLAKWVARHIDLISSKGTNFAALIASKSPNELSAEEREAGWTSIPGKYTSTEIDEALRLAIANGWIDESSRQQRTASSNSVAVKTSPLKWFGGKHYLADGIIALMPAHIHYVEPFAGSLAVMLRKPCEGVSEVTNDKYGWLSDFWTVIQDEELFEKFRRRMEGVPFSQQLWARCRLAGRDPDDLVESACRFFIVCRQSRSGGMRDFATLSRTRCRRKMNEQASAWLSAVEGLPTVHNRLKRVVILCDEATKVIRAQDGPTTCHYLDPPYIHATRSSSNNYAHEMTGRDHAELLDVINGCRGAVLLSGYRNSLYDRELANWNRHDFDIDNKVSGQKVKRRMTESVWCNY